MSTTEQHSTATDGASDAERPNVNSAPSPTGALPAVAARWRWAMQAVAQPLLFFLAGAVLLGLLGMAQRMGWISSGGAAGGATTASAGAAAVDYICPMMCTPPQQEPGRCPVCAMELVPAAAGGGGGDERSIVVDPASRRVANIQTVAAQSAPLSRTIRAVGQIVYNEGTMKTISAYTGGRFDALYVDFTGAVVQRGERLASFYSPELYSAHVEYLQVAKAANSQSAAGLASVVAANQRLRDNSRQRLIELGMSETQIAALDRQGQPQSRMDIVAPMSGTVIEKLAVTGEYVKEGEPVIRLADLSTVWLMLELFPADAAVVRQGQTVEATLKSLPGRSFSGQVTFIDPHVDPMSRTVDVRVVMENPNGSLRIGDYAKAHIQTMADSFTQGSFVTVPRSAVLMAANQSIVYVETDPGRFAIRRVLTGPASGDRITIVKGLAAGEMVATAGNFLLDSQMQLAGNPSLIDPTRAAPPMDVVPGLSPEMLVEINKLPEEDRERAMAQVICPVTDFELGSMGVPPKVIIDGQPIFLCCEGCRESLLENPEEYLARLEAYHSGASSPGSPSDLGLPPIGQIEPAASAPDLPPIGMIELLPVEVSSPETEIRRSANSGADSTEVIQ